MAEVVVKNFELDRIPQTMPGTRKHAVEKPVPQLRKRGFDALSHLGQQGLFLRGIGPCENQHTRFLGPLGGSFFSSLPEIAESDAAFDPFQQGQYRGTVIPVAGGQHQIHNASIHVAQHRQLKTKEPTLAGFAKPRAVFPQ